MSSSGALLIEKYENFVLRLALAYIAAAAKWASFIVL